MVGIIGDELRKAREAKGYSLLDAENTTKIRMKYLEAIENEDFNVIPGKVYLKGFIKNYAGFLGVDTDKLLNHLNEFIIDEQENYLEEADFTPTKDYSNFASLFSLKYIILYISIIGIGFLLITNTDWNTKPKQETNISKSSTTQPIEEEPNLDVEKKESTYVPTQVKDEEKNIPSMSGKVKVVLQAIRENSWALIKVDGVQKFMGIIKKNQQLTFTGQKNIFVHLGNAGAIDVSYNNMGIGTIGPMHKVIKKTFTREGIK